MKTKRKNICSYIFDNEAVINFDEPSLDLIWSSKVDFLEKDKEFAKSGKTPKSLYKDMKHFTFFDNYYKAMKLLNEEQCGEYIKALCECVMCKKIGWVVLMRRKSYMDGSFFVLIAFDTKQCLYPIRYKILRKSKIIPERVKIL